MTTKWFVDDPDQGVVYLPEVTQSTGTGRRPTTYSLLSLTGQRKSILRGSLTHPRVFYLTTLFDDPDPPVMITDWYQRLLPYDGDRTLVVGYEGSDFTLVIDAVLESPSLEKTAPGTPGFRTEVLRFLAPDPAWRTPTRTGLALSHRNWMATSASLMWKKTTGWTNPTVSGSILVVKFIQGRLWVGGNFLSIDGDTCHNIAYYDPVLETWVEPASGILGEVYDILELPDENVLVVGNFVSDWPGVITLHDVALYNVATDSWLTTYSPTTIADPIQVVILGPDGYPVIGGSFTGLNTTIDYLAKWDGTTWVSPEGSISDIVYGLCLGVDNCLYVRGSFPAKARKWNQTTAVWTTLGSLTNGDSKILQGPDGTVYTADGDSVFRWSGTAWEVVVTESGKTFKLVYIDPAGEIWVDGWGGAPRVWRNGQWVTPGWYSESSITLYSVHSDTSGQVALGYLGSGISRSAGVVSTSPGGDTLPTEPVITMTGPGEVLLLENMATQKKVYFQNLILIAGEEAVLNFEDGTFISNWRGDLMWSIHEASDFYSFRLLPTLNPIFLFIDSGTPASGRIDFYQRYEGLEAAGL